MIGLLTTRNGNKLSLARNFFWDLLFPRYCVGCGQEGDWLCWNCQSKLRPQSRDRCPLCGLVGSNGMCVACRQKSFLDNLLVVTSYDEPTVKKLIWLLKYHFILEASAVFRPVVEKFFSSGRNLLSAAILVPVPLHWKRDCWRGFNQATLIAQIVQEAIGGELREDVLLRRKNNYPQAKLAANERHKNINGAFTISRLENTLKEKLIILVDDLYTTGATMQECAKILKNSGAKNVWGLVLARKALG